MGRSVSRRVSPANFGEYLEDVLSEYRDDVGRATAEVIAKVGDTAKQEIQSRAPVRTGRYKAGWTVKKEGGWQADPRHARAVIHNRTRYQLTHLLENGHVTRSGGRVRPIVHIAPAEEHANKLLREAFDQIAEG